MKYGMVVSQPGLKQRWVVGNELIPVSGQPPEHKNTWFFPKADDYLGLIYKHTHSEYLYRHPDGRIFEAWTAL